MNHVTSHDGTRIAYEIIGEGPVLVLIGGAFCDRRTRASGTPLAALLAPHFTVVSYDRRGRGDSTDSQPWAIDREVEDVAALLTKYGHGSLFGISSGGLLALEAAARELPIDRVAVYDAPVVLDDSRRPSVALADELTAFVASGDRSAAVEAFLGRVVGTPSPAIAGMKRAPVWSGLEALAHTLAYDVRITANALTLLERAGNVRLPVDVLTGGKSPLFMLEGAVALTKALPNAHHATLPGQTHDVDPSALANAIIAHLRG